MLLTVTFIAILIGIISGNGKNLTNLELIDTELIDTELKNFSTIFIDEKNFTNLNNNVLMELELKNNSIIFIDEKNFVNVIESKGTTTTNISIIYIDEKNFTNLNNYFIESKGTKNLSIVYVGEKNFTNLNNDILLMESSESNETNIITMDGKYFKNWNEFIKFLELDIEQRHYLLKYNYSNFSNIRPFWNEQHPITLTIFITKKFCKKTIFNSMLKVLRKKSMMPLKKKYKNLTCNLFNTSTINNVAAFTVPFRFVDNSKFPCKLNIDDVLDKLWQMKYVMGILEFLDAIGNQPDERKWTQFEKEIISDLRNMCLLYVTSLEIFLQKKFIYKISAETMFKKIMYYNLDFNNPIESLACNYFEEFKKIYP